MKKWVTIISLLLASACSVHTLGHKRSYEPVMLVSANQMQFNCTDKGLFIFENFPSIVSANTDSVAHNVNTTSTDIQQFNNGGSQLLCAKDID